MKRTNLVHSFTVLKTKFKINEADLWFLVIVKMSLMLLFSHLCGSEFILSSLHLLNLDSMHFHFRHTSWDTESWERDTRDALYGKGISEISALHRVFFSVFYSTHVIQKFLFNMLLFEFNFVCHSIWSGSIHTPLLVACFPFHTFST